MNKALLVCGIIVSLIAISTDSHAKKIDKIIVFPFKMITKGLKAHEFSNEMAGALAAELSRDGDIEVIPGMPFLSAVQEKKVDPQRLIRIAEKAGAQAVIWGDVTQLEDGLSSEVYVLLAEPGVKPRFFSTTGRDFKDLATKMKEVANDIGGTVLNRPKVGEIKIEGNKRIQREAILNKLEMKTGSPFSKSALSDDIREIYSMGYFDDVQIKAEENSKGEMDLLITLKERPSIKTINIEGNKVFSKDEILDALTTKSFTVASLQKIRDDVAKIKQMYEKEGYYQPTIDYDLKELTPNEASLTFKISEGNKSYLTDIDLEGRSKLPAKDIKKIMTVKEKSWFWFLDESGTFTREKLDENRMRIIAYYLEHGFINVQVGAPKISIEGNRVKVSYPIREGDRFQIRKVNVEGDLVVPAEQLTGMLESKTHTWFKRSALADDIKTITKLYNNLGYAYADVEPIQKINEKHDFVDLIFKITKGDKITIERVDITGNDRTRDKIIRRALTIAEGDIYNADSFEATKNNLEGMDFFEAVKLKTSPGSRPDTMNVTVEVIEKKTGSLAAGLGYSSQDGAMGNIDLKERNLFGMGIVANAKANLSARRSNYEGSLTYPWIFDYPVTASIRGYQSVQGELQYVRDSNGGSLYLSYPLYGLWSMSTGFARDSSKLSGFQQMFAQSVVAYYAKYNTNARRYLNISENSVSFNIGRDTRNNSVIPTAGTKLTFGARISGFGGDVAFSSCYTEGIYYKSLFWRAVLKLRANASMLLESNGDPIPFDRRILLGGIQSIRGYKVGEVGPRDRFGSIMGGDRAMFSNLECLFPLVDSLKLNGVTFFDIGNAWNVADSPFMTDVKAGIGLGVRWISPMGPLRIEYGWKLNPERGEDPGAFAFAMGQLF
ncbi:MAG: outer membrane protein assembly factor BamA [Desulfomonilaceae bacterium]